MEQLVVTDPPAPATPGGPPAPPPNPFAPAASAPSSKRLEAKDGIKQEVFALDSGEVVIQWPESLTQADYDDIVGWLDILKRKMGRGIKNEPLGEN